MSVLVQVSDPHFGTERPDVVDALVAFVADRRPEVVVLSGDITQRATRAQFDAARAFVARLPPAALVAIPGNHDVPLFDVASRVFAPYRRYRAAFGHALEPVYRSASWLVVGVRTTRRWRHENGEVSARQVERVAGVLRTARPEQIRVVVVHQPVAVDDDGDVDTLLRGREPAIVRWDDAGADIVMGGHNHVPYVIALHAKRPTLARPLWCVQAGTAVSSRVRAGVPNSVNVLRHDDGAGARRGIVERWDYDAARRAFVPTHETALVLT